MALIVALVTALVGPHIVDWNRYRGEFETEASRLVGAPVRISGPIAARLLPTPSLSLHSIEASAGGAAFSARTLRFELALGPLMRGEFRVSELWMNGPQLRMRVDAAGRLQAPLIAPVDPDRLSIERISIERGRIVVADENSRSNLVLDGLAFRGELRSLAGPLRGDGSFASSGGFYRFRIATSRGGPEGVKLRASLEATDQPLRAEANGLVRIEDVTPRYEGSLTLSRPAGAALVDGQRLAREPWRATGQVKADPRGARAEAIEFQYGPDDRPLRLTAKAMLALGESPHFTAVLAGRQVDLDRLVGTPDANQGGQHASAAAALGAVKTLFEAGRTPMRGKLEFDIDALTFGGAVFNSVRGTIGLDSDQWDIETVELRGRGSTQIRLSGRLEASRTGLQFAGPASIESSDLRGILTLIEGDAARGAGGVPLRMSGDLVIGAKEIVIDRLQADIDNKPLAGRIAYAFADASGGPARLDAALRAEDIDLQSLFPLVKSALADTKLERPGNLALALSIGKLAYADIQANRVDATLRFDGKGLALDRFSIGDLRGASLSATGLFDTSSPSPRGTGSFVLDAPGASVLIALAEHIAPRLADHLRQNSAQLRPAELRGRLDIAPAKGTTPDGDGAATQAQLAVHGRFGAVRVNAAASAYGDPAKLGAAIVTVEGALKSENGKLLAGLVQFDRLARIGSHSAAISFSGKGRPDGDIGFDLRLAAEGLTASAVGTARYHAGAATGQANLTFNASDARPLISSASSPAVPVTLESKVEFADRTLRLTNLDGQIAGSKLGGRFALTLGAPLVIDGGLQAAEIDVAEVVAALIGAPRNVTRREGEAWSAEPFAPPLFDGVKGEIGFEAERAEIFPEIVAQSLKTRARFDGGSLSLDELTGNMVGGVLNGTVVLADSPTGVLARLRLDLAKADLARINFGRSKPPASGSASFAIAVEGSGRSPAALISALNGTGTLTLEGVQLGGLDAKALDTAIRAADRGLAIERLPAYLAAVLDQGSIAIPSATTTLAILDGRITMIPIKIGVDGTDADISGTFNLADRGLNARITLTGPPRNEAKDRRPEISVLLNGPLPSPRRDIDTTEFAGFVTLRAVERESKRVEAAEREAKRREEAAIAAQRAERERLEQERALQRAEPTPSASESDRPARPPALPPPVEIKPQPSKPARPAKQVPAPVPQTPPARPFWDEFWGRP